MELEQFLNELDNIDFKSIDRATRKFSNYIIRQWVI